MTLHHIARPLGLLALATVLAGGSMAAWAEETGAAKRCPPVYGTWRTTHDTDVYGNFIPASDTPSWAGLVVDKKKAVLLWAGDQKETFRRTYKFKQTPYMFTGSGLKQRTIEIYTNFDSGIPYPDDNCYLDVSVFSTGNLASLSGRVLMKKIK
jgi:hypothetical protein